MATASFVKAPPMTWEDFRERAQQVTEVGVFTSVVIFHILLFGSMLLQSCSRPAVPPASEGEEPMIARDDESLLPYAVNIDDDKEGTVAPLSETLSTPPWTWPEARAVDSDANRRLYRALSRLSPAHAVVLILRFGLFDGTVWTLEEISERIHVSKERARQLQDTALRLLRRQIEWPERPRVQTSLRAPAQVASVRLLREMRRAALTGVPCLQG